jgi:hypothetical protein
MVHGYFVSYTSAKDKSTIFLYRVHYKIQHVEKKINSNSFNAGGSKGNTVHSKTEMVVHNDYVNFIHGRLTLKIEKLKNQYFETFLTSSDQFGKFILGSSPKQRIYKISHKMNDRMFLLFAEKTDHFSQLDVTLFHLYKLQNFMEIDELNPPNIIFLNDDNFMKNQHKFRIYGKHNNNNNNEDKNIDEVEYSDEEEDEEEDEGKFEVYRRSHKKQNSRDIGNKEHKKDSTDDGWNIVENKD